jgi:hypothetical protein
MPVKLTKTTLGQLKQSIRTLAKSPRNQSWFDLSRKLDWLHRRDRSEFHDIFREGNLNQRTAYYLRNVGRVIRIANLTISQAERVGWTKLQIIGGSLIEDKENARKVARLLKLAEQNNAQELRRLVSKKRAKSKPNCVLLYFTDKQYEQLKGALIDQKAISKGRGIVGKEEAIMRMIRLAKK